VRPTPLVIGKASIESHFPVSYVCLMKKSAIVIALLVLAAVSVAEAAPKDVERAREAVRRVLKDPESARFTGEYISSSGAICGRVNAKNSYGGYIGPKSYVFTKAGQLAIVQDVGDTSPEGHRAFTLQVASCQ
jgi:hypothetical protein